ncbi:hypothetical protein Y88_3342 [Novosphingobium nitrogenifigens DSM 19370]|uniref:CD-NTase-associated protein 12/Pycsar effector protein TIR domain-containing protein n=1 Tax=Novosphingobium nitrogenifigens DSM 19370 TaxID=983920 RepID=F1ZBR2_9SPHN|nr:nucleotide-binding protein [Novosphingobium nitrogenifigens]EGD58012.1 hypothetical protein Y88_3342 [Novosphingobium nitrogenifigens DSM 19370]
MDGMTKRTKLITPEEEAAYLRMFAESYARNRRLMNAQRFNAGQLTINLVKAPDDPGEGEPAFQDDLARFGGGLRAAEIPYHQTAIAMDSVAAHGFTLPEFVVAMQALGPPAITAIAGYAVAWMRSRKGRSIRIAVGDVEVEASTLDQVEHALQKALMLRDRQTVGAAAPSTSSHTHYDEGELTMPIEDDEIRGVLLKHFHNLRHNNGGWVPISETVLAPHPVELRVIGSVCQQLADIGLIDWKALAGDGGIAAGMAKITGKGVAAVERRGSSEISIRFPSNDGSARDSRASEPQYTPEAASAVYAAIEGLIAAGKRAYAHNVPLEAQNILLKHFGGRLRPAEASDQIQAAIVGLAESDKIEIHPEPRKDWLILEREILEEIVVPEVSRKIFVVHGRDDATKNEVSLFLGAIGLEPIILHMRPNGGRHLLTKFREEADGADFAVVLMTPDDEGGLAGVADRKPRARQNVVLELGFFLGKLGPANVAALVKDDVEKPSDFDGIAYIPFDAGGTTWKTLLARELQHAKVPFDPAKVLTA